MSILQVYSYLLDALSFVLVLGVAIIIHEAGHFVVARLSGIRVEKFSIGFGKALFSFKRGHTEYIIAPIPMGGYVKMAGDNPAEVTGADYEFYSISPWKRIPTVLAGPLANVLGAFVIFFALAFLFGKSYDYNVVGSVLPQSAGAEAGLQKNDVLLSADGETVETWAAFEDRLVAAINSGEPSIALEVQRGTETLSIDFPTSEEALDRYLVVELADPVGPAYELGVREGDRILALDGVETASWTSLTKRTRKMWEETPQGPRPKTATLTWQTSEGEVRSATITPALIENVTGETIAQLGIAKSLTGISPKWPPVVARIARGFPTRDIGIESGAEVVAINGTLVDNVKDVQRMIRFSYEAAPEGSKEEVVPVPLELTWRNPGESELRTATITPEVTLSPTRSQIGLQTAKKFAYAQIGLAFAEPKMEIGLIGSCRAGIDSVIHAFEETIFVLKGLFTGQVNAKLIGGPVAILQLSAHVGKEGLQRLFWFCAFLQVNLALLNLLPIPILDGGHIVVSVCEGVSRRSFTLKQREYISYIGAALLIPLFVFVFYNDFDRIGLFDFIKELFS